MPLRQTCKLVSRECFMSSSLRLPEQWFLAVYEIWKHIKMKIKVEESVSDLIKRFKIIFLNPGVKPDEEKSFLMFNSMISMKSESEECLKEPSKT